MKRWLKPSSKPRRSSEVHSLLRFVRERKFDALLLLLLSPELDARSLLRQFAVDTQLGSFLHCLLPQHPNLELVHIVAKVTDDLTEADADGKTALHIACQSGCETAVVECLLLNEDIHNAAALKDNNGCLALHYACARQRPEFSTVAAVLEAYPEAVVTSSDRGVTPLQLAKQLKTSHKVIDLLQSVSQSCCGAATVADKVPLSIASDSSHTDDMSSIGWEHGEEQL